MKKEQFSFDGLFKRTTVLSFDETGVFIGERSGQVVVPFADVVSLSSTHNSLGNRYFWKLEYRIGDAVEVEIFRPNSSIWKRSFHRFHARLSEANPACIKTPCRWWSI